jgi:hypothetical protein
VERRNTNGDNGKKKNEYALTMTTVVSDFSEVKKSQEDHAQFMQDADA